MRRFRKAPDPAIFPLALGERIPEGHPVRRIARALSELDLGFLRELYEVQGGVSYPPENLLAVVVFGMSDGVWSSRGLQDHCLYDARYQFLMGGRTPDDRTFGRFLERIAPVADRIFSTVLGACRLKARVSTDEVALDGTRVAGASSFWGHRSGASSDPDARMQDSHSRKMVGYNAQLGMDTSSGFLVSATVVGSANDSTALGAVLDSMLSQAGELPGTLVADGGYESHENVQALEEAGVRTCIAPRDGLPECLDCSDGVLRCPAGKELVPRFECTKRGRGGQARPYVAFGVSCKGCPLAASCPFHKKRLHVPKGVDPAARFRNRDRVRSEQCAGAMERRRQVERPFGQLKRNDGFRGFLRRGLEKVRVDFTLWACSYNIRRLLMLLLELFWRQGPARTGSRGRNWRGFRGRNDALTALFVRHVIPKAVTASP